MQNRSALLLSAVFALLLMVASESSAQTPPLAYVKTSCINPVPAGSACMEGNEFFQVVTPQAASSGPSDFEPSVSPDGTQVAFSRNDIYLMSVADGALTQLTYDSGYEPAWAPTGSQIAYVSIRDGHAELYIINQDGSDLVRLTYDAAPHVFRPSWSPDGTRIAFECDTPETPYYSPDICVINADGSGLARLTSNLPGGAYSPSWSPDGSKIVFVIDEFLAIMNADGSVLQSFQIDGQSPKWSPDGSLIAYATQDVFIYPECIEFCVFTMGPDGSSRTEIVVSARDPAWIPTADGAVVTPQAKLNGVGYVETGGNTGNGMRTHPTAMASASARAALQFISFASMTQ